ncbi:hypothetical protein B9Z51_11490 [Limnohabitans sp. T6-5]|nr:hypothetical protein B9Z51_11490 [Limnohabitans sp. T6-5]
MKLQRLGIYAGTALLVLKAHHWIGTYAIGFCVLVPIGLTFTSKKIVTECKKLVDNIKGIERLVNAQAHVIRRWQNVNILHRQIKLTDTTSTLKFDQYIEDQDRQCWHISSNGQTLNIKPLDSSLIQILKKSWK